GSVLDPFPIGLEVVRLEEVGERAQQGLAVDLVLALARGEVVDERLVGDAALPVGRADGKLFLEAKTGDTGELDQITAVAALGELGDAPDAADAEQMRLALVGSSMDRIGLDHADQARAGA